MSDITRRLKKAEKVLNVGNHEKQIAEIVSFGGGEPPKDHDNVYNIIRYVRYEDVCRRQKMTCEV
jgi:hypothetical protein